MTRPRATAPVRASARPRLREVAFAVCLTVVLTVGVVGVLLLNTSMQQQSDRLDLQRQQVSSLHEQIQQLRMSLDHRTDPTLLAAAARRLHMRPVTRPRFTTTAALSRRTRAAGRAPAG